MKELIQILIVCGLFVFMGEGTASGTDYFPFIEEDSGGEDEEAPIFVTGNEDIQTMINTLGCPLCHTIPSVKGAVGTLGPKLTTPQYIGSFTNPKYKGKAKNLREYVVESILKPNVYIVFNKEELEPYPEGLMPITFRQQIADKALNKIVDYLLNAKALSNKENMIYAKQHQMVIKKERERNVQKEKKFLEKTGIELPEDYLEKREKYLILFGIQGNEYARDFIENYYMWDLPNELIADTDFITYLINQTIQGNKYAKIIMDKHILFSDIVRGDNVLWASIVIKLAKIEEEDDDGYQYELDVKHLMRFANTFDEEKNYKEAFKLYSVFAKGGDTHAQVELGRYYQLGHYVEKDIIEAMDWYKKASKSENKHYAKYAYRNMSFIYEENGNYKKAYETINLAIEKGYEDDDGYLAKYSEKLIEQCPSVTDSLKRLTCYDNLPIDLKKQKCSYEKDSLKKLNCYDQASVSNTCSREKDTLKRLTCYDNFPDNLINKNCSSIGDSLKRLICFDNELHPDSDEI